ncbi:DUF1214 domain-containing protein [Mycolicibacterium tusciae]|uniref:DUF1214 domain-containing protein n=1 Tax=Mycolicibacterium tusciae TaxID=75922 RepID=A0A1X0JMD9_9MYCO|nr:DUF1214 domain-containing protein [Mycolicibacterium tusciae]ORB63994.1 hypothetical protein BST47_18435 [Mycolicibacterium tusciae]
MATNSLATTSTGYGRFIGRVGALAVVLGIGVAVANSPAVAWAQDGTSGASDSSPGGAGTTDTGSAGGQGTGATGATTGTTSTTGTTGTTGTTIGVNAGNDDANNDRDDDEDDDDDDEDDDDDDEGSPNDGEGSIGSKKNEDDDSNRMTRKLNTRSSRVSLDEHVNTVRQAFNALRTAATASTATNQPAARDTVSTAAVADPAPAPVEKFFTAIVAPSPKELPRVTAPAATVSTDVGGVVGTVLSALGFSSQAATGPTAPPQPPMAWAMLGWVRRELGNFDSRVVSAASGPVAALVTEDVAAAAATSPLATPQQFSAEEIAEQTAQSFPVTAMKLVLRQQFLAAANRLYPDGIDAENMAQLDRAVDEYARAASFQQLLLDSMNPTVVAQVAPPHFWDGRYVAGSRILYDNPDTVYRFIGVNGASTYVIRGQFHDWDNVEARPTNVTFSVLSGASGTTTTVMTITEDMVNEDGSFEIIVDREPADGRPNHLQLTNNSTIIAVRDTLGDWNDETPMSLTVERVAGPPPSLFAQLGGFAFFGESIVGDPLLVDLVSTVPPAPYMPPALRGAVATFILIVRGASEQEKYMALATTDPETGEPRPVNTVSQPSSNAEFLANQLQSNGHFQLEDDQALVLTIDPGDAGYFVVPTYNVWTITNDYRNEPASLNMDQAKRNPDGTYTVVISPTDPLAANWISTNDLNQGTLAIRFQDIDPDSPNQPRIVDQRVMTHDELREFLPAEDFITEQDRLDQIESRQAGFDRRWT